MVYKVVSIEDEPEIAELLRIVLDTPEIDLRTADNGTDGLNLIRTIIPDLITLDIMLPGGLNGWEVYDAIRADETLCKTPIIMLSVMREETERRLAFRSSEIDLYVHKPFDTLRLRRDVERMLGGKDLWKPPTPAVARAFGVFVPPTPPVEIHPSSSTITEELTTTPPGETASAPREPGDDAPGL